MCSGTCTRVTATRHVPRCERDEPGSSLPQALTGPGPVRALLKHEVILGALSADRIRVEVSILDGPVWSRAAQADPSITSHTVTFAILDRADSVRKIARSTICLFGKRVQCKVATTATLGLLDLYCTHGSLSGPILSLPAPKVPVILGFLPADIRVILMFHRPSAQWSGPVTVPHEDSE
jgi:hypothetical protein